jgi:hypothetical protein
MRVCVCVRLSRRVTSDASVCVPEGKKNLTEKKKVSCLCLCLTMSLSLCWMSQRSWLLSKAGPLGNAKCLHVCFSKTKNNAVRVKRKRHASTLYRLVSSNRCAFACRATTCRSTN